jgi:hypothetical protein
MGGIGEVFGTRSLGEGMRKPARIAQWHQAKGDRTEPLPSEGMR